jgi:phenylalanyl-tRNA synthetase beta chain
MNISYNWLRDLTGFGWGPEELRERLTMAGLEVESAEETADGDFRYEIAVLSNRPDWMSHLGVAREVGVMTGGGVLLPETVPETVAGRAADFTSVALEAADLCPRFTARVVRGVRVGPSPAWLAARLEAVGRRSINNVADITNFVMLELGQPLHAFDLDKLAEQRIVVRRARAGERLTTLDGAERELDAEMLVIADAARAVAVAGVMGGAETEISDATQNVLVECAYFSPQSVRRTARAHGLQTDASERFERGVDFDGLLRAQARTVSLITRLAGGAATEDAIDIFPEPIRRPRVRFRPARVRALTGLDVPAEESARILAALGFSAAESPDGDQSELVGRGGRVGYDVPTWRTDATIEEDLVEEVARHFGYARIEAALPPAAGAGEYRAHEGRRRALRRALAACGFDEAISFSFIDTAHDDQIEPPPGLLADAAAAASAGGESRDGERRDDAAAGETSPSSAARAKVAPTSSSTPHAEAASTSSPAAISSSFVTLTNPIIEGATRMRPTLLAGLLAAVRHNLNHGTRDVRLFEAGRVFAAAHAGDDRPAEREALALVATGGALEEGQAAAPRELDFYDLKGAIESAASAMNLPPLDFAAAAVRHLREGQSALVSLAGRAVGYAGRLSEELAAGYKFRQPVYVAELSLSALFAAEELPVRYAPLARFPSVVRDVTLVAPRRDTFEEMRRAALDARAEHLRAVRLVYVYEGERVPEGSRSVTLRLEYRSDERTLRDEEVDALHARVVSALEEKFGDGG